MPRWIQNSYFGGISGDQFVGIPNSAQSAKNITFRDDSKLLKLAPLVERSSTAVITDLITAFVTVQSSGDVVAFGDSGKIYVQTAGTGSFVLKYTDPTNRKILSAYEYNGFIYWTTPTKLHRLASSFSSGTWSGNVQLDFQTFLNGNALYHPMLEVYNKLYIGDGSTLAEYDEDLGSFNNEKISIFGDEEMVALTFNGARVKFYSHRTSNIEYGRCYLWDGVSQSYNEFIAWEGLFIHSAVSLLNRDYVLAGKKPALYASSGYSSQRLKKIPGFTGVNVGVIGPNSLIAADGLVFFGSILSGASSMNRGVWSYGAKEKDFPFVLNNEFTTSNGNAFDSVGAVHFSGGNIYVSWQNGSTYGLDISNASKYASTGEWVTRAWDGGASSQLKEPLALKIGFKQLAAGEKIEIFFRRNLTSSWGTAVLTVDYANASDRDICYKELLTNELGTVFNFLEMKIVLTSGTSNATTPSLSEVFFEAEFVQI